MIKIDIVIKELKGHEKLPFDKIWSKVKNEIADDLNANLKQDEAKLKAELLTSMMVDERLVMLGNNTWSLKDKIPLSKLEKINSKIFTEANEEINLDDLDNDETEVEEDSTEEEEE